MFDHICRTCLDTCGELVPIFSNDYYVRNLPRKLQHTINIEVRKPSYQYFFAYFEKFDNSDELCYVFSTSKFFHLLFECLI